MCCAVRHIVPALVLLAGLSAPSCRDAGGEPPAQQPSAQRRGAADGTGTGRPGPAPGGRPGRGPAAVVVETPQRGRVAETITYSGEVRAEEIVELASIISGRVVDLYVELGQLVERDALLIRLDQQDAEAHLNEARAQREIAEAQIESARVRHANLQAQVDRNRPLMERGLVTEGQFDTLEDEVEAAAAAIEIAEAQLAAARSSVRSVQTSLDHTEIRAPFAAQAAAVHVDEGAVVSPGMPLIRLVSADRLVMRVQVNETEIRRVATGQHTRIRLNAFPDRLVDGRVVRVGAQVDPSDRAVPVEIAIDDGELPILDGMSGTAELEVLAVENALFIPQIATHSTADGRAAVWLHQDGHAFERFVELGLSDGMRVEVRTGLDSTDEVIVQGQSLVNEGGPVIVRNPL